VLFVLVFIAIAVGGYLHEKKRREVFAAYCRENGFDYLPGRDRSFDDQYREFPGLRQGSNRYLRHQMLGKRGGCDVLMGEYHYQVTRSSGKNSSTRHYYFTLVLFRPPWRLPDISIREEGMFDWMKAAFGWDDIDFASAEFSRRYHVTAPNRNDAFALIQPRTMDLLLRHRGLEIHARHGWLMVRRRGSFKLEGVRPMCDLAESFLGEVPDFVREGGVA